MDTSQVPAARPQRGDELELTVDTLAYGGAGVARTDSGYVVFVSGGLPAIGSRNHHQAQALLRRGTGDRGHRPEPRSDRPDRRSPGAPWQVLTYERQLEIKTEQVRDALVRIGKLEGFELEPIVRAVEQWRYRNKLEYSFGTGPDGELQCGFHAPGRWDQIVRSPTACSPPRRPTRGVTASWSGAAHRE